VSSAADRTRNLLDRFRTSSLYQEMNAASLRLHEIPYTYRVGDSIDSGKIDALFQQDRTWTVVEFKTDRLRDRSELDTLLDRQTYLDQCRRYAQAIQQLLGQQPKVLLCLLDYARQVHVQPV
jgi:ATP-dependent exoDNAse (exonuclease V) beta subunit